eukprot:883708-Pleurochrysis_carterae.AAC.1
MREHTQVHARTLAHLHSHTCTRERTRVHARVRVIEAASLPLPSCPRTVQTRARTIGALCAAVSAAASTCVPAQSERATVRVFERAHAHVKHGGGGSSPNRCVERVAAHEGWFLHQVVFGDAQQAVASLLPSTSSPAHVPVSLP